MKWFKKKTEEKHLTKKSIFDGGYDIDKSNWREVFSACLGKMRAIQNACGEFVVKDRDWNVDFQRGVILFGRDEYPLQFIGSESQIQNTWLWGWVNINGFDKRLLTLANKTNALGKNWRLEPLINESMALDEELNGHNLSIITCGISDEKLCYYKCPYSGGAAYVALSNVPDAVFEPVPIQRFVRTALECMEQYRLNDKIFIESFLRWNNTPYEWQEENRLVAHFEQDLTVLFEPSRDGLRILSITFD
mgnify:CR=1 FL=1